MRYTETVERYSNLFELQSDIFFILKKFRDMGNLDVEVSIDLLELSITIISPQEGENDN